jgi:hypothetical protein
VVAVVAVLVELVVLVLLTEGTAVLDLLAALVELQLRMLAAARQVETAGGVLQLLEEG